jgi:hypothetical protein
MIVVDDLARTLIQAEIPIGIITALLARRCLPGCWCSRDAQARADDPSYS